MARRPGRPRASGGGTSGRGTAQDVLDAAAQLFCTVGYTSTSTYAIAERAGVRQASIYHHFAGKHEILRELLLGTVRPSLANAERLAAQDAPAAARLWALCHADVALLSAGRDNLGALYLLPEVADDRFAEFHAMHAALRERYATLAAAVGTRGAAPAAEEGGLVLGLVESVILRRRQSEVGSGVAPLVADAALRILGLDGGEVAEAARVGRELVARLLVGAAGEGGPDDAGARGVAEGGVGAAEEIPHRDETSPAAPGAVPTGMV